MVNIALSLIDIFVCDEKEGVISQQWGPGELCLPVSRENVSVKYVHVEFIHP